MAALEQSVTFNPGPPRLPRLPAPSFYSLIQYLQACLQGAGPAVCRPLLIAAARLRPAGSLPSIPVCHFLQLGNANKPSCAFKTAGNERPAARAAHRVPHLAAQEKATP